MDIIRGASEKPISSSQLIEELRQIDLRESILYIGYPIIGSSESVTVDALLVSKDYGLIAFDLIEGPQIENRKDIQDEIYTKLYSRLLRHSELVTNRSLEVKVETVTFAPAWTATESSFFVVRNHSEFLDFFAKQEKWLNNTKYSDLVAAIQAVTKLRIRSSRTNVTKPSSKGSKLKKLEESIANLDRHQSSAVLETVDGVQRIRGLAGSGKTIVLALKVAYLHAIRPDWLIGVTFHTRSLTEQFEKLITKFTIEQKQEEPDWEKIRILNAWGSPSNPGIYYEFTLEHNLEYYDYLDAKRNYTFNTDKFRQVVIKSLKELVEPKPKYDVILVDEAQDLSEEFLRLCYLFLKPPKRLIFAYDELQKLRESQLRNPKEFLGADIHFENLPDKPHQDIILEKCYRNPKPLLVTAHGLGFGIYREGTLVQMFDEPELWKDLGYEVVSGKLDFGEQVILERTPETSPPFLEEHSSIEDLIIFKTFNQLDEQSKWIADQIEKDIKDDELQFTDIMVIHVNALKTKDETGLLRAYLYEKGINSHLCGVTTSPDQFFQEDSIAVSSIYRAKGNEAAMVYIMGADYCYSGFGLMERRNTIFSAITRSKAWVRVCGIGSNMGSLTKEFEKIKANEFKLKFRFPTQEELKKLTVIFRDMSQNEKQQIKKQTQNIATFTKLLQERKIYIEDIPESVRDTLKKYLNDKSDK